MGRKNFFHVYLKKLILDHAIFQESATKQVRNSTGGGGEEMQRYRIFAQHIFGIIPYSDLAEGVERRSPQSNMVTVASAQPHAGPGGRIIGALLRGWVIVYRITRVRRVVSPSAPTCPRRHLSLSLSLPRRRVRTHISSLHVYLARILP